MHLTWWPAFALVAVVLAGVAHAQSEPLPSTLLKPIPVLYATADGVLDVPKPAAGSVCGPQLVSAASVGPPPDNTKTYVLDRPKLVDSMSIPINGTYRAFGSWVVQVGLTGTGQDPQQAFMSAGFSVTVTELRVAGQKLDGTTPAQHVAPGASASETYKFAFKAPENPSNGTGSIEMDIQLTPDQVGGAVPAQNNVAVECGPRTFIGGSSGAGATIFHGAVGDRDFDQDRIPDSIDPDKDGDGLSNAAEKAFVCDLPKGRPAFEDVPAQREGDDNTRDHDGDGYSDRAECDAKSDPLDDSYVPLRPEPFPWPTVIFLALLALFIVLALLNFLVWGRVAELTVLSTRELIVPRGGTGRFDLEARGRRTKGREITFQLQARGLPEGWDAKLSKDHVVLGPRGSDRNVDRFTLTVEAPEHEDPESAVILAVAVPLSGSGRKDTFKTAARAKTITSINVPPNAKVPVKRGEDPKLRTEAEMAALAATQAAAPPAAEAPPEPEPAPTGPWREKDRPVLDLEGVGETYAKKLEKMGIATVQALHAADTDRVAKRTGAPATTVRQWQSMAELLDVDGVGPQVAELLVRSGVRSVNELAHSEPKELAQRIEATNEGREVRIQGGPAGPKATKNWTKAAQEHPLADVPSRFGAREAETTPPAEETAPAPTEAPAEATPKRGLFGRRRKEPESTAAPAEPGPEAAPAQETVAQPEEKKRFGLFGRRPKEPGTAPPDVLAEAPAPAASAQAPAAPSKPNLQVGGLQHSPPTFRAGDQVRSSVTVTNQGEGAHTIKLSLFVNDALADAQTATVKPGKSKEVKFKWTAQDRNKLNIRGELVPA